MAMLRNKKGVSVMIGYILLVVFALSVSVGIYSWLRSYVPGEGLGCPDGVSLYLKSAIYNAGANELTIEIVNNGRFSVAGYFIHMTDDVDAEVPTVDLSDELKDSGVGAQKLGGSVFILSGDGDNSFSPGSESTQVFDTTDTGRPYLVRITPTRQQNVDERQRFVGCGEARTEQVIIAE